jgi:hypothetical protein
VLVGSGNGGRGGALCRARAGAKRDFYSRAQVEVVCDGPVNSKAWHGAWHGRGTAGRGRRRAAAVEPVA